MVKLEELPIITYFMFMLIYYTCASDSDIWSGLYFVFNSFLLFFLFKLVKNKIIRYIGMSLSISVAAFCVFKFFFGYNIERAYTLIPFGILIIGIIYLQIIRKTK